MKKRDILMAIVALVAIINIIFSRVVDSYPPILQLLLTLPFYMIILIFYRKTTLITIFCILTILSQFGFYMVLHYMTLNLLNPIAIRVFGSFSFFAGIIGFFVAFALVLQHKTYKFTEVSFLLFSIVNYTFFSYFNFYLMNLLIRIFGPFEIHIIQMQNVYFVIQLLIEIGMAVIQVLLIYYLERNMWYELRLRLRDQEILHSKITDQR